MNPASIFGGPNTGEIALDVGTRNSEAAHRALSQVFGSTPEQRCRVHETANVLNKLGRSSRKVLKAEKCEF